MYARRETFGAMYGNAYGFAKSSSNAQLDWTVDGQAFNVLYLGLNGNNGYVAPGWRAANDMFPPWRFGDSWKQLPMIYELLGIFPLPKIRMIRTIVDQFTATDNNGQLFLLALSPSLPSQFSPVLWLGCQRFLYIFSGER